MNNRENWAFGQRIRQNHALEHATVTVLADMMPNLRVSARSNPHGFVIYGDLDPQQVRTAANEALHRLQAGEAELAIHPNCGTNLSVGLALALSGCLVAIRAVHPRTRIMATLASMLAGLAAARPLGQVAQKYLTTLPDQRGVRVTSIVRKHFWRFPTVEVRTIQE